MKIQLLRHATLLVTYGKHTLLVDPMLSAREAMDPVGNAANSRRIPMVDLPIGDEGLATLIQRLDAIIVTHTHRDHWDARAVSLLPKPLPLICQREDIPRFQADGFTHTLPVERALTWQGLQIIRTAGQHGTGEIGNKMGKVSGFVLRYPGEPSLYIAGDTIWCPDVRSALEQHSPEVIVVNAGAAQFLTGDPITMTAEDVIQVARVRPSAKIIAVHMDTINHCLLTRENLRAAIEQAGLSNHVQIPADGETLG